LAKRIRAKMGRHVAPRVARPPDRAWGATSSPAWSASLSPMATRTDLTCRSVRDAPVVRTAQPPSAGEVVALPRVGGLHHRYSRAASLPNDYLATTGAESPVPCHIPDGLDGALREFAPLLYEPTDLARIAPGPRRLHERSDPVRFANNEIGASGVWRHGRMRRARWRRR
jgi:hypothetical protein